MAKWLSPLRYAPAHLVALLSRPIQTRAPLNMLDALQIRGRHNIAPKAMLAPGT